MGYEEIPQPPVVRVTDDWNGKEIDPGTTPLRVTIDGQRLALYLGADTKAEVQGFIRKMVSKGSSRKTTGGGDRRNRSKHLSDGERAQRKVEKDAYAKAHGKDPETTRWSDKVHAWYIDQGEAKKTA